MSRPIASKSGWIELEVTLIEGVTNPVRLLIADV
jgi:hypothetical protein